MTNIITDQLQLVEKIYIAGFVLFASSLKAISNCDQVVFQGDRNIGLVSPDGEQRVKIRKGDIIIRVYRTPRFYRLTGTIATKDNYKRVYEIPIEITVSDPTRFAIAYFQEKDPAGQAIDALKNAFERSARKFNHDTILGADFPFGNWSRAYLGQFGVHIEQKGRTMFREDPFYSELSFLHQSLRNQEEKIRAEEKIQQLQDKIKKERDRTQQEEEQLERAKQRDFERQEKTKDQLYEISSNLRQVAAGEIAEVLKERIHEGFVRGRKPDEISHEYFEFIGIFGGKTHIDLEKSIMTTGLLVDGSVDYKNDHATQTPQSPDTSTHEQSS